MDRTFVWDGGTQWVADTETLLKALDDHGWSSEWHGNGTDYTEPDDAPDAYPDLCAAVPALAGGDGGPPAPDLADWVGPVFEYLVDRDVWRLTR